MYYFTGEYDAMSPITGFIEMLRNLDYDSLRDQRQQNLGYAFMKSFQNVSVFQVNGCGQQVSYEKPEASYKIVKRMINSNGITFADN